MKKKLEIKKGKKGRPKIHDSGKATLSFSLDKALAEDLDKYLELTGQIRSAFLQTAIKSSIYKAIKKSQII